MGSTSFRQARSKEVESDQFLDPLADEYWHEQPQRHGHPGRRPADENQERHDRGQDRKWGRVDRSDDVVTTELAEAGGHSAEGTGKPGGASQGARKPDAGQEVRQHHRSAE